MERKIDLQVPNYKERHALSSTAVNTDFTAKLIEVYRPNPDSTGGFDLNLGDGIIRAHFREFLKKEKPMKPSNIYPLTINLYPTSNLFKMGHLIGIAI